MRLLFLFMFLTTHAVVMSQKPLWQSALVPHTAIKVSPLHLLNFYPTIEWSFERRILPRFTIQAEAGYVLNYGANTNPAFQNKRGVKLKLEGRYYFGSASGEKKIYYGAVEPYINIINFDRYLSTLECFDLECSHRYRRQYLYNVEYREHGVSLKTGVLRYLDAHTFLDISFGFTLRNVHYREPARPRGFDEMEEWNFFRIPNEDDRTGFSPNAGLRFGYRFN